MRGCQCHEWREIHSHSALPTTPTPLNAPDAHLPTLCCLRFVASMLLMALRNPHGRHIALWKASGRIHLPNQPTMRNIDEKGDRKQDSSDRH